MGRRNLDCAGDTARVGWQSGYPLMEIGAKAAEAIAPGLDG